MTTQSGPTDDSDRQRRIAAAFTQLANPPADQIDTEEVAKRLVGYCRDLVGADGVGVMFAEPAGDLRLYAASSEQVRRLENFELDIGRGPCLGAYHSGEIGQYLLIDPVASPWGAYTTRAHAGGWCSVHAIPLRQHTHTIGVINLLGNGHGPLTSDAQELGRAFADVATTALLTHRPPPGDRLHDPFQGRLDIEQAAGKLGERHRISPDDALHLMRHHARTTRQSLAVLARDVLLGVSTLPDDLGPHHPFFRAAIQLRQAEQLARHARDAHRAAQEAARRAHALRQRAHDRHNGKKQPTEHPPPPPHTGECPDRPG